jgi:nucleoid-associated protein YgaU
MPGVGETLQTSAGPLPVWAWAGLGTAGIAGYLIYRKKQNLAQQAAAGTDSSNLGNVPISNLVVGAEPMPVQGGDTFIDVNNPPDNDNPSPPTPSPTPPPKMTPPPPPSKKPPTPPPVVHPPVNQQTYTVVKGDTLFGIAKKFYGDGNLWHLIYNANKAKIGANPNLIKPGQILIIPKKS